MPTPPLASRPAPRLVRRKADPAPVPGRLRWQAYESFRQQLLTSKIRPGQFVSQRQLVALTGLPLGAIREVIPRLEAEGLLVTVPQRGLQIANVDVKLIHNAFLLRLILEREAVAQFAHTVSDAELDSLEAAHRDILARAKRNITPALLNAARAVDWGLHDAMIDAMGNELISAVYRTVGRWLKAFERPALLLSAALLVRMLSVEKSRANVALKRRMYVLVT